MGTPKPSEYSYSGVSENQEIFKVENLHLRFGLLKFGTFCRLIVFSMYQCDQSASWVFLESSCGYGKWYFKQTD